MKKYLTIDDIDDNLKIIVKECFRTSGYHMFWLKFYYDSMWKNSLYAPFLTFKFDPRPIKRRFEK